MSENSGFTHLHLHTEYSLLDGAKKLSKSSKSPPIDLSQNPKIYYKMLANDLGLNLNSADKISNLLYEFRLKNMTEKLMSSKIF